MNFSALSYLWWHWGLGFLDNHKKTRFLEETGFLAKKPQFLEETGFLAEIFPKETQLFKFSQNSKLFPIGSLKIDAKPK
ncbi:MAG: hypothetical protein U7127_05585 [Phormidium sp.]